MKNKLELSNDYYNVADVVHRLVWAFDHNDWDMFRSAFTEDGILDNGPLGSRVGLEFPVFKSREEAVNAIMPMIGPLDTSHTASNFRITFSGEKEASLVCNVMAQHFRPGEGPKENTEYYLMMNLWSADLMKTDLEWRIRKLIVDCAWTIGNMNVVVGQ